MKNIQNQEKEENHGQCKTKIILQENNLLKYKQKLHEYFRIFNYFLF